MKTVAILFALCLVATAEEPVPQPPKPAARQFEPSNGGLRWVWTQGNEEPCSDIVRAGVGLDRNRVYLGRARHDKDLVPALVQYQSSAAPAVYVLPNLGYPYNTYNIHSTSIYEVLCGDAVWQTITSATTRLPSNAVPVGYNSKNETLYACRVTGIVAYPDIFVPGYVRSPSSYPTCVIPYSPNGQVSYNQVTESVRFELLVRAPAVRAQPPKSS